MLQERIPILLESPLWSLNPKGMLEPVMREEDLMALAQEAIGTLRNGEVLQLTSSGYSNAQIASAPEITVNTVDSYKERIKGKFGLDSIVECVATAAAKGIVTV